MSIARVFLIPPFLFLHGEKGFSKLSLCFALSNDFKWFLVFVSVSSWI